MKDELTLTQEQGAALREKAKSAVAAFTQSGVQLARALYHVFYGTGPDRNKQIVPLAVSWGYEGFDDYAEHELHIHQGTARSYVRTWDELFIKRGLTLEILPDSIQQLRVLAKISSRSNIDARDLKKWVTKSKELSCCEFEAEIEEEFGFGKGKRRSASFDFPWNRAKKSMSIIRTAKQDMGVSTTGEALATILEQWEALREKAAGARKQAG